MCKDACNADLSSNNSGNHNDLSAEIVWKKKKKDGENLEILLLEQIFYLFTSLFCVFQHNHDQKMVWGLLAMEILTAGRRGCVDADLFIIAIRGYFGGFPCLGKGHV